MSSVGTFTILAAVAAVGGYALLRSRESGGPVKTTTKGGWIDYKNPADATSDKRPEAAYFVKPYQIFNPGGGVDPMEVDFQGQPTGRELALPGKAHGANAIAVGLEKTYDYQNARDAHVDQRPEAMYLVKPYQILNPGGGQRPMEVDAQGAPTGRQVVMPNESPTVAKPSMYVMVGQGLAEHGARVSASAAERGAAGYRRALPSLGRTRARGEWGDATAQSDYFAGADMAALNGFPDSYGDWSGEQLVGYGYSYPMPKPYSVPGGNYGGGGGFGAAAMRRRMWMMRQQMQQQQLAQQQAMLQQQLQDQLMQQQLDAANAAALSPDDTSLDAGFGV